MPTNRALTLQPRDAATVRQKFARALRPGADEAAEIGVVLAALSISTRKALACATTQQVIDAVIGALPLAAAIAARVWLKNNPARAAKIRAAIAKAQADIRAADKTEAARA